MTLYKSYSKILYKLVISNKSTINKYWCIKDVFISLIDTYYYKYNISTSIGFYRTFVVFISL